jgi:hypothetical protein
LRNRNFEFFDFFTDRCAAASAGASSRGENHAGYTGRFQALGYVFTDVRGVFHCGMSAAGRMTNSWSRTRLRVRDRMVSSGTKRSGSRLAIAVS